MKFDDLDSLVPQNKFDVDALHRFSRNELDEKELAILIPRLFSWIADMNWPVAFPTIEILCRYQDFSIPLVEEHLGIQETDDELKYNLILYLLPRLPHKKQLSLLPLVQRIAFHPTEVEKFGSLEAAQIYLERGATAETTSGN